MSNTQSALAVGERVDTHTLPYKDLSLNGAADFVVRDGAVLLKGSRSASSGSMAFPSRVVCMDTGARDMEDIYFGPKGRLYSYSTVRVSSSREVPYTLGYVDFDNGIRVLAHVHADPLELACDIEVETVTDGEQWFVVPCANKD